MQVRWQNISRLISRPVPLLLNSAVVLIWWAAFAKADPADDYPRNPDYLEWSKFGPGTELVYWSMSYTWKTDLDSGNRLIKSPGPLEEISTYTLSDRSAEAITVNVKITRKYLDSDSEEPYLDFQQGIPVKLRRNEISSTSALTKFPLESAMASGGSTEKNILRTSGKGKLEFNGRILECNSYGEHQANLSDGSPERNTTYWYCDLLPGKLLQRIVGTSPGTSGEPYQVTTLRSAHLVPNKQTTGASPATIDLEREISLDSPELTGSNTSFAGSPQETGGPTGLADDGSVPPLLNADDKDDPRHDPEFRFWSKFKPGTQITFITKHSVTKDDGQRITDKLSTRDSLTIKSSDNDWIEISCSEATLNEGQWYGPPRTFSMGVGLNELMGNSLYVSKRRAPWMSSMTGGAFRGNTLPVAETGTETIKIAGQVLQCRWFRTEKRPQQKESRNATYWVCDKVPGRFVRATVINDDNSSFETAVESIHAVE